MVPFCFRSGLDDIISYVGDFTMKRDGYISWDEYFMGVASLSAQRSKILAHRLVRASLMMRIVS